MPRRRKAARRLVRERIARGEWVPQPKMQHPRFRTELASGSKPERFYLGNLEVPLEYEPGQRRAGRTGTLARVSLKESTIPGAGLGVHLREDVLANRLILLYWGDTITMEEAQRRKIEVCICIRTSLPVLFPATISSSFVNQCIIL